MSRKNLRYGFGHILSKKPPRSKFNRNHTHLTAFNAGELIPILIEEIQPGDNWKIKIASIIRQSTLIKPIMDTAYIDVATYWVPYRIIMDNWKKFMGENNDPWAVDFETKIPKVTAPSGGWETGTIADYMNIPIKKDLTISALQFRAYAKIVNDWYRDQNLQEATHINFGDSTTEGSNGNNYITDLEKGGKPFIANKYHDYYTSCLPGPQKGEAVTINIGGKVPVTAETTPSETGRMTFIKAQAQAFQAISVGQTIPAGWKKKTGGIELEPAFIANETTPTDNDVTLMSYDKLYADLSQTTGLTINQLRNYIVLQQMLEKDARSGTRYVEFLKAHFGVTSPDATQQRSEFLGGTHEPLEVHQVSQTTPGTNTSPQANLAAFGQTNIKHHIPEKTFMEHGVIITLACIRYKHTYQQGIEKQFMREERNDFHDPIFSNIGEQPIYNYEIFAQGNDQDKEIFGFNEPWIDYRVKQNRVTGKMRSTATQPLDAYHYADNYNTLPKLSPEWIQEDKTNLDRTLAIKSTGENAEPQFQVGFMIMTKTERPLPVYSIPGLNKI